jgi:hypothetical protein
MENKKTNLKPPFWIEFRMLFVTLIGAALFVLFTYEICADFEKGTKFVLIFIFSTLLYDRWRENWIKRNQQKIEEEKTKQEEVEKQQSE